MFFTWIRPAIAVAACALLCGPGRPDDKIAPPPRPVKIDPEQLRKEWQAKLAGQTPEQIAAILEQLTQEWTARKGAVEVAHHRFTAKVDEWNKARQRLGDLKEPGAVPPVVRASDVAAAVKAAQDAADAHATRIKHLDSLTGALGAVLRTGDEFTAVATAADEHLFKMQTAAALAKSTPGEKLPAAAARLKALGAEVKTATDKAAAEAGTREKELAEAKAAAALAVAKLESLKTTQANFAAALAYEERLKGLAAVPLADEFNRLRKELAEKSNAIKGDEADYTKFAGRVAEARARLDTVADPLPPTEVPGGPIPALVAAQQHLTARLRTFDERAEKTAALVAALDEQEKKATAYSSTLNSLRDTAGQLTAAIAEIERRVGRGDLEPAKAPEGVSEAAGAADTRAKLDAEVAALQAALGKLRSDRDLLRKPDPEAESAKALVAAFLANVNERLDLHAELRKLAVEYATARKDRPEAEQKRIDQRAADRVAKESNLWDMALALDRSKPSTDIVNLLDAYYKELVELDEKAENLKFQKESLEKLVELTRKEADSVAKLRTLLEKQVSQIPAAEKQESWLLATKWDAWLAVRLAPDGLKAEADAYHSEAARLGATGGANTRRVQSLTSDIGKTRGELVEARARGLGMLAIKILLVLLAALVLPRIITSTLRRTIRGGTDEAGNPSPVLRPLRGVLKLIVWAAALAVILSILGYDVTAFVVALAIGTLAVALAARPMIADALGSVTVFAERRFKPGDVVRVSGGEPARVVGLTWRSTALKNANGVVSSVPNRTIAEATVENLTRGTEAYDTLTVTVSTDKDAGKVINVIRAAMAQCKNLSADQGVTVVSYVQKGPVKLVQYRFWWFLKDYEARNKTRDEVFARIAVGLANEDMTGIEIALT